MIAPLALAGGAAAENFNGGESGQEKVYRLPTPLCYHSLTGR
jgi:hypothetical protein